MEHGNVAPNHKKGNKYEASNFRPISIMNNLGKLLEVLFLSQVGQNTDKKLPAVMHGFKKEKITDTALVLPMDQVLDTL